MPSPAPPEPGFVAISGMDGPGCRHILSSALASSGVVAPRMAVRREVQMASWGIGDPPAGPGQLLPLTRVLRVGGQRQPLAVIARWMAAESGSLATLLPPFAAAHLDEADVLRVATDSLGFRQIYLAEGAGWSAVSTSARLLAQCLGGGLDREALAIQSRLGWQVAHRTLFKGVTQIPAGHLVVLNSGGARLKSYANLEVPSSPGDLESSVEQAAQLLQTQMAAVVADEQLAVDLQLTGGQDSRLLLSAIPRDLRSAVTSLTVKVPDSQDAQIAERLSRLSSMPHQVVQLAPLGQLTPIDAYYACASAAARLECMADPVALAAIATAEAQLPQRIRIAGLGGEVARGFYYLGRLRPEPVSRSRSDRLASWRMFANERVQPEALDPDFEAWAQEFSLSEVHGLISAGAPEWFTATDEFYLWNRVQRWAGARDTAVAADRELVNPMLDRGFLDLARALSPVHKQNARYLSLIQMRLDPALGHVALDSRPAPAAFARHGPVGRTRITTATARKAFRKASQRLGGRTRPPAGGQLLAARVAQHWRDSPSDLEPARRAGVFSESWLDHLASGHVEPTPAEVALLVNLCCATNG